MCALWRYCSHENQDFVFTDAEERVSKVLLYQNILLLSTYNYSNSRHEVNINVFMLHVSCDSDITNCSHIERLTNIQETFHIKDIKFNSIGIMQLQYSSLNVDQNYLFCDLDQLIDKDYDDFFRANNVSLFSIISNNSVHFGNRIISRSGQNIKYFDLRPEFQQRIR